MIVIFLLLITGRALGLPSDCPEIKDDVTNCNSTIEILCSKGYSEESGCPIGHYCYEFSKSDPCDYQCPCNENQLTCHSKGSLTNSITGCPPYNICIAKEIVNSRGKSCPNFCSPQCGPGFKVCAQVPDGNGCLKAPVCVHVSNSCPTPEYYPDGCPIRKKKSCKEYCPKAYDENGCLKEITCAEDGECPQTEYDMRGCSIIKTPQCEIDEVRCSEGVDEKNCLKGIFCQAKVTEDKCINFCPTNCNEEYEMICPRGKGLNGCPLPDICIPKIISRVLPGRFVQNCSNHCRPVCDLGENKLCPPIFDADGCAGPDTCISREKDCPVSKYDHKGCLIPEEPQCDREKELLCHGGYDINGCQLEDTCLPRMIGDCPQLCPVLCESGTIQCPGGVDERGCPLPDSCVPKVLPGYDKCQGICPTICNKKQVKCLTTRPTFYRGPFFVQTKHCVLDQFCMDMIDPTTNCSNFCPVLCGEREQSCEGPVDEDECSFPDICVPKVTIGGRGNECEEFCPLHCPSGERPCAGRIDSDSCRGPPICVPLDEKCPSDERDVLGCPLTEEVEKCDKSFKLCLGIYDDSGCRTPSSCIPENEACPEEKFNKYGCELLPPTQCQWDEEILCPSPRDERNCPMVGKCIKIKNGACNNYCDPICNPEEERLCNGGSDANQCPFPKFCSAKHRACPRNNPITRAEHFTVPYSSNIYGVPHRR